MVLLEMSLHMRTGWEKVHFLDEFQDGCCARMSPSSG